MVEPIRISVERTKRNRKLETNSATRKEVVVSRDGRLTLGEPLPLGAAQIFDESGMPVGLTYE